MRWLCPLCFWPPYKCHCFEVPVVQATTHGGTQVWALGYHAGPIKDLVHRLKYQGETFVADWLGAAIAKLALPWPDVDALVPVPLHPQRLVERGYNQSALLAKTASAWRKKPTFTGVAQRRIQTLAQAKLTRSERRANVVDIFEAPACKLALNVLIVDDVVTTGGTADALKNTLEAAGYGVLGVLAVSVAQPKQP